MFVVDWFTVVIGFVLISVLVCFTLVFVWFGLGLLLWRGWFDGLSICFWILCLWCLYLVVTVGFGLLAGGLDCLCFLVCLYALIACVVLDLRCILVVGLIAVCGLLLWFPGLGVCGCFSLFVCVCFWFILFVVVCLFAVYLVVGVGYWISGWFSLIVLV